MMKSYSTSDVKIVQTKACYYNHSPPGVSILHRIDHYFTTVHSLCFCVCVREILNGWAGALTQRISTLWLIVGAHFTQQCQCIRSWAQGCMRLVA
jgi:hypothetical protein